MAGIAVAQAMTMVGPIEITHKTGNIVRSVIPKLSIESQTHLSYNSICKVQIEVVNQYVCSLPMDLLILYGISNNSGRCYS